MKDDKAIQKDAPAPAPSQPMAGPAAENRPPDSRIGELEALVKRLQADFENFRKRTEKEKTEMHLHASAAFLRKLLPVADEFEHAIAESKKHKTDAATLHGFEMVHGNLMRLLRQEGLKEMDALRERFDPYRHDAIRYEENEAPEGAIIAVVRKGYLLQERVLRPAAVIVSKGKVV